MNQARQDPIDADKSKDPMRGKRGTGTENVGGNSRSDLSRRTVKDDEALGRGIKSQKTGPSLKTSPEMSVQRDLGEEKPKTTGTLGRRRTPTVSSGGGETPDPMPDVTMSAPLSRKEGTPGVFFDEGDVSTPGRLGQQGEYRPTEQKNRDANQPKGRFTGGILTPRVYPMLRLIQPNAESLGTTQQLPRI